MEVPDKDKERLKLRVVKPLSKKLNYNHPRAEKALREGDIQGVIDGLNVRQRRFCEEYIVDYNGAAAISRAGYGSKYPNRQAYQLLRNPAIKACIDQLTAERAKYSVVKPEFVTNKIVKTIEKAEKDNNHNAVLRGCELLARSLGMFLERTEISGPDGKAIELKQIRDSAEQVTSAIAGLVEREREGKLSLVSSTGNSRRT